jgi:hypothetical protein
MPWLLNPGLIVDPVISGFYDAVIIGSGLVTLIQLTV